MPLVNYHKYFFSIIVFFLIFNNTTVAQTATTTDILKNKIEERNNQIKQLEAEISQYNIEITNTQGEAKTLQGTIKTLDLTKKKISTDINLTENKIEKTSLTIDQIDNQIDKTQEKIENNKIAIGSAIKSAYYLEENGFLPLILSNSNIGEVWTDVDNTKQIRESIREKTKQLGILQKDMSIKQEDLKGQKNQLVVLKQDLSGKKQAVELTAKEKADLLKQTKNKEQAFVALVKTKEQLKDQFEKEVFEYESQLHYMIDTGSYPKGKLGIFSWPLDDVYITQRFGKTVGAEKLYTSGSHNGIDLRASIGTKVKNVLDGTVMGTGNTDIYPGCYSFGKWVFVQHDNGLSTIYGHLSVISAQKGQRLSTGDTIGFSGNTGYSTGPHLHISVYASQGVKIEKFVNSRGCKEATLPLADVRAYLDPLAYFPSI
jgi:murein DD-endopeptidase MepM/ murein hydrolase activator NlpD